MDAGVVSNFRPQAFASRTAAERVKDGIQAPGGPLKSRSTPFFSTLLAVRVNLS